MRNKWIVLLAAAICGSANSAESTPAEWPKECAGRLQLALPGEADQAAILGKERFRDVAQYSVPSMRFPDGQESGWGKSLRFTMTHPLTDEEKKLAIGNREKDSETNFIDIKVDSDNTVWHTAFDFPNEQYGPPRRLIHASFLLSNGVYLSWGKSAQNEIELSKFKAELQSSIANARPRKLFDIPHQPGLCLPYIFIPDNGQEEHSIAMTYRLKEHPEITVHLKGKTAASTPTEESQRDWRDGRRPEVVTNEYQVIMFWGAKIAREKSSRSLWHSPTMRPMKLAGRPGLETFLAVVWKNETEENYIYHAVARGDPDNPEAAPDVQLVVEQKRKTAIKHGITPLTQDEVLKLAQRIAASVMVRPTR